MDLEEEDEFLFTHKFIKRNSNTASIKSLRQSNTNTDKLDNINDEFEEYYRTNKGSSSNSLHSVDEPTSIKESKQITSTRFFRKKKTVVSIDSRDRDILLYPYPNHFKIFLGKTFYNVQSVELQSIEFPNTNAVVNSRNNKLYWINHEDIQLDIIDTITQTYPIYTTTLRTGSYIASKLQNELDSKLKLVKRRNNTGNYHYFISDLNIETDVVSFVSLILTQLGNNAFQSLSGTGIVVVEFTNHGRVSGDTIYVVGARSVSGISGSDLNKAHVVTVINDDIFSFEVDIKANTTDSGGGSNIKIGIPAPFQLLYGNYPNTIAPNIGFKYENSSQQIQTFIKSMTPLIQLQLSFTTLHNFTTADINSTVIISNSNTTPSIDGIRTITRINSLTSINISIGFILDFESFNIGTADGLNLTSITNVTQKTYLFETFTRHNVSNNENNLVLYNTKTEPTFDGINLISSVLNDTQIILYGEILTGGSATTSIPGDIGYYPTRNPITSINKPITSVQVGNITTFTVINHDLNVGDLIQIIGLTSSPSLNNTTFKVYSVLNSNTFTINTFTSFVDLGVDASIATEKLILHFPGHGFNSITSITSISSTVALVQTRLDHNLQDQQLLRIMETTCIPSIDGSYIITVVSPDSFEITVGTSVTTGFYGVIGMSLQFTLYNSTSVGGISNQVINGSRMYVYEIIDEDNFIFKIPNYYCTFLENNGGNELYINSYLHGFNGSQDNLKNGVISRSITLEGENYCFLTCPQLNTVMNTGKVENVFARISLDQSPGAMCFNFLSNPKVYDESPLNTLGELEFSMINYDNTLYEFNDLNYSFVLEITEVIDTTESFNINSRRGVANTA